MQQTRIHCKGSFCLFRFRFILTAFFLTLGMGLFDIGILPAEPVFAQEAVLILEPKQETVVISKKPIVKCRILVPFLMESLYIEIDQTDMTALATVTDQNITITPFHVLPSGNHRGVITFLDENNTVHTKPFEFFSRHSDAFEQISSENNISVMYSQVLGKMDDAKTRPVSDWATEANLNSQSMIADGPWEVSFTTNARYTDQAFAVSDPLEKGFSIIDYTVKGKYDTGELALNAALGDVTVEGTKNIVNSLSRRGGSLGAEAGHLFLTGFTLRSQQLFGIDNAEDIEPDTSDHLVGVTGGGNWLDDKLGIKAIYVNGGESANAYSYGIWPTAAGSEGDAYGLEVKTDFFEQKLTTLFEYDLSDFDADTSDDIDSKSDKAYLGKLGGFINNFNYEILYEYTGPDYKVTTGSLQPDRKGFTARSGLAFENQSIQLNYGEHNDNIEGRATYSRIDSTEYGTVYNLDVIASLPVSIGWQRSLQDSSLEPEGTGPVKTTTDIFFGSVSYIQNAWVIGLQPEYVQLDDQTSVNYDTESSSITLFSSYNQDRFSLSPSVSFNRFKDCITGIEQDTINYNLSFLIHLYDGLAIEGAGSYAALDSSDSTVDQDNFNGDLQLSYTFQTPVFNTFSPKILLRATHDNTHDNAADTSTRETIFYLLLSGSFDLSL